MSDYMFLSLPVLCSDCLSVSNQTEITGEKSLENVKTLQDCQTACIDDKACVAIDWVPSDEQEESTCFMYNTSDATADTQIHENGTRYQPSRACLG